MIDWNIQSRAHTCQACGKHFADQQHYHTLLFDAKHEFKRQDVCEACWQAQFSEGARDRKGFVSYWQGVYEAPPAAPPEPMQKETVESLLRKIMELNDPQYTAASYILAVMLERKRLLKIKEQLKRDGQRIFIYEHPKSGDVFTIPDPDLQLDQLEQVQHDVAQLLEHGLNPPPETAAVSATSGTEAASDALPETTASPEETLSASAAGGEIPTPVMPTEGTETDMSPVEATSPEAPAADDPVIPSLPKTE